MKRKQKFSRGKPHSSSGEGFVQTTVRIPAIVIPFNVASVVTSTHTMTPAESGITGSFAIAACDTPGIGGRVGLIGQLFNQVRLRGGLIRYRPNIATSQQFTGIGQNSCYGVSPDPSVAPTSYVDAIDFGGKQFQFDRAATYKLKATGWKYTALPPSPVIADYRQCCLFTFFCYHQTVSPTTADGAIGTFQFELDLEWRWPENQMNEVDFKDNLGVAESRYREKHDQEGNDFTLVKVSPDHAGALSIDNLAKLKSGLNGEEKEASKGLDIEDLGDTLARQRLNSPSRSAQARNDPTISPATVEAAPPGGAVVRKESSLRGIGKVSPGWFR